MSQSAENQSAIIENENNSNIVMESQAAITGDAEAMNVEDAGAAEVGPETPTQDEAEESMEIEARGRDDQGDYNSGPASSIDAITDAGDASQDSAVVDSNVENIAVRMSAAGDGLPESLDAHGVEPQSHSPPEEIGQQEETEVVVEEEKTSQPMDVEDVSEPGPEQGEAVQAVEEPETEIFDAEPETKEADQTADNLPETTEDEVLEAQVSESVDVADNAAEVSEVVEDSLNTEAEKETAFELSVSETVEASPDPVLETAENTVVQEIDQDQQAEAEIEKDDEALIPSQTEEMEASVSAEDEDRLLADDGIRSQKPEADSFDVSEAHEDQSIAAEDDAEVIEDSPKAAENPPEVNEESHETIEKEVENAPKVTEDAPQVLNDASDADENTEKSESVQEGSEVVQDSLGASDREEAEISEDISENVPEPAVQSEDQPIAESADDAKEASSEAVEMEANADHKDVEDTDDVSIVEGTEKSSDQVEVTDQAEDGDNAQTHQTDVPAGEASDDDVEFVESKPADDSEKTKSDASVDDAEKQEGDTSQALDAEGDRASDATIEEGRDAEDEPMLQVTDVKSGVEATDELVEKQDVEDLTADDTRKESKDVPEAMETETSERSDKAVGSESAEKENANLAAEGADKTKSTKTEPPAAKAIPADDDDDVVVLDDDEEPQVKKEAAEKELFNSNNDMGIQIESVSGGADELHEAAEQQPVKQENGVAQKPLTTAANITPVKKEPQGGTPPGKKTPSKTQTCIVCKRVGKCKYNIVRNGDIKHLCDDICFKRFRTNPTMYLKGTGAAQTPATAAEKKTKGTNKPTLAPIVPAQTKQTPGYKTCVVCQLMNINTQGQFCMWKGLDFCGEGCLGKFQAGISTSCTLCTAFIPLTARSTNCLRLGNEVRPFCSSRCYADYKLRMRLCTFCQKDLATTTDSFSAPVGSEGSFKDFCSQICMKKYEDLLTTDVEIIRVEPGKPRGINKCSVCQKNEVTKHAVKYNGVVNNLCSDPCLSAFQYANKLDMTSCDFCGTLCTSLESSPHMVQFEGHQKRFCSDSCVTKFRFNHRKVTPCSWCGSQRDNFDMIERLDSNNKYQLFCSLNCLSLYRVNLQAKSNQAVTCDQCLKYTPAQYHLTMSDASVRNFCSYNCVMTFQAQFSKGAPVPPAPTPPTPRHKHNTRGKGNRGNQQAATAASSPSFPIISNVVSLAPQGGQKVNIKNSTGVPVVVSGAGQNVKTTGTAASQAGSAPVQQQIIIQPPPPKQVKNKSLLCKPFVQTKATSCRPHTQTKYCQTDEVKEKPVLIPVPVPVYVPTPMALYAAPAPTPVFIPIPIPVPIFIPTTRKSANGIMKQIKEIQEKTPADPLEAEILMMAAAVSADGKNSSDSDTEEEVLPEINKPKKRPLPVEDDDDADVMPLTNNKEEEGGEEDMISMALRMAEEMSGPIADLESAVEAVPINTEPPPPPARAVTPEAISQDEELNLARTRRGAKRGGSARRGSGRPPKRQRVQAPQPEPVAMRQDPVVPPAPPADAGYHLKFTYGVNAWRHWVLFKNAQIERNVKPGSGRIKLFKTDIMQCTADELNFSLCLFVKEVRKPNGDEYSPDSIYYLTLGIQQYLFENGRIDNIFADLYYEKFTECLTEILSKCQPKFNTSGQMVCRIEEEHLWECKQLGAHSPYVLLNTLIYFHTKYFMLKTPEDHMKLSFAHILKYWKKGQPGKGGQPTRSVSLRYYSVSTAKKDGSAPTSTTKKGSKEGIPVYEVTENQENPLRCPVKLYEFYLSKCPESIKNRSDIFYPVPERSCVPDSPVWYSTMPINLDVMTKMLTRILLVREIQEAHLHAQPIYV